MRRLAEAGDTLRRLQVEAGYHIGGSHSIANDVLIALSARAIGAMVVTQNERDSRTIERIRFFRLSIVRCRGAAVMPRQMTSIGIHGASADSHCHIVKPAQSQALGGRSGRHCHRIATDDVMLYDCMTA